MVFCTVVPHTTTAILRSRPILKVAWVDLGDNFELCPLWNIMLSIVVALSTFTA